jgi:hypothetical protein
MKKKAQLDFYQALARNITPDAHRTQPQVWFQQVAILRKLDAGAEHEVRRISLQRGLNILWAPPENPAAEVKMYEDGLSGHASGKTLFCRLLRYLLGEGNYGDDAMVQAVGERFPELWVLGEVIVAGQLWLVARPMTENLHKFAAKGVTVDSYLRDKPARGNFDDFTTAVEEAACGQLSGREEANELFRWRYLLPWLARDQECRFASLTDWRSSLSGAERPQTSVGEQQLLVRAFLDVLKREEQLLKTKIESTEGQLDKDNQALPSSERQWQRDWNHWTGQLKRLNIDAQPPTDDEKLDALGERVTKFSEGVEEALRLANEDKELTNAQESWQSKRDERIRVEASVTLLTQDVEESKKRWQERASKREEMKQRGIKNPKRIEDGFCPHTLPEAITRGCVNPPPGAPLETNITLGEIQTESDALKAVYEEKRQALSRVQSSVERLEGDVSTAWTKYQGEQRRVQISTKDLRVKQKDADAAVERFEQVQESFLEVWDLKDCIKSNTALRDELKQRLDAHFKEHTPTEQFVSDLFADVVRAVMGSQVKASAQLSERGILLKAERNGDLHGAALETIKVLAFDIAAMASSIEGKGHHPRFLVHDGPREADMSRVIYERFFLYAKKLEESTGGKQSASFQYIITTTTPPPKEMQRGSAWLLDPVLDGAKKTGKLLKEDF